MNASSGLSGLGFLGYSAFYCIWKGLIPAEFQDTYSWISRLCMLITVRHIRIFKLGHRTRLSGIIPHFHVFSSYECSSQLCTRFSSVLYNTHRFSLPLCVGLVVILLMDRTIWSSILFTVDISFSCLILTHNNSFLRTFFPDDLPPHPTALQSFTVHAQSYLISLV